MLDWPYAHLLVNHFSVVLTYLGLAAVLLAVARRRRALWLYAVATLTLAGLAAYPAVFTGERAAPALERQWFVDEAAVDEHEEAGERAQWLLLAMGALSGYAWWRLVRTRGETGSAATGGDTRDARDARDALGRALPAVLRGALVVAAVAGSAAVAFAAYEGGFIVHKAARLAEPPTGGPTGIAPARGASPAGADSSSRRSRP